MRQRRTSIGAGPVRWAAALLALAVAAGCSNGDGSSTSDASQTTPTVSVSEPSTTTSTSPTTTATPSATTATATPTPTKTRWPKALGEPQEGSSAWAVYLAVAHSSSDAALQQAQDEVGKVGYGAVIGDLACDRGSIKALGLDEHDYWTGAVLYFSTKKDADDFANSYLVSGGTVVGTAKIGLGCLD
jgi:hypothetical protein